MNKATVTEGGEDFQKGEGVQTHGHCIKGEGRICGHKGKAAQNFEHGTLGTIFPEGITKGKVSGK